MLSVTYDRFITLLLLSSFLAFTRLLNVIIIAHDRKNALEKKRTTPRVVLAKNYGVVSLPVPESVPCSVLSTVTDAEAGLLVPASFAAVTENT